MSSSDDETKITLHVGYAEQGKLLALAGRHTDALRHYREALRLAVASDAPPVFAHHYTQCVLESLEHTGAWDEILKYCDHAEAHYAQHPPDADLTRQHLANVRERRGVVLLKAGRQAEAQAALTAALQDADPTDLPVARAVLGWLRGRYHIDLRRLRQEQDKHLWFVVRAGAVDASRAIPLPAFHPV